MKFKSKKKVILLSTIAFTLVISIGIGIFLGTQNRDPVGVYPFNMLGMTEYWGDSQESYGPVTTDKIQTIFLSDTQVVTEIHVAAGDTVKKGDLLMTFDTTLSDLALERKRLDVEKKKLQLEDAKKELRRIKSMKPMVIPNFSSSENEEDSNLGTALSGSHQLSAQQAYDGSTKSKSLICWLNSTSNVDEQLFETIRLTAEHYQNENAKLLPSSPSALPADDVPGDGNGNNDGNSSNPPDGGNGDSGNPPDGGNGSNGDNGNSPDDGGSGDNTPDDGDTDTPSVPTYITVTDYYVIFKVTKGNMSLGTRQIWQGLHVYGNGSNFYFKFFDAYDISDHMMVEMGENGNNSVPQIDFGSGYTSAQIAQMRSEQEKKIKELEFSIKMTDAEYKIMQLEVQDGNVYSEIDGEVISVLTEEEARLTNDPIVKISGGGGFYVEGSVNELEKDKLTIGQEVTINDWRSGMTYTGTVESIGDFPVQDGWNGMGNPNASYYPFKVFIDGSADLQAGNHVSVVYSASQGEHGIYLQNPFVRTEQGKSYVFILGEDGKLEKRYVTTGKSLWGSYTEILNGLTEEDLIAFPYGKNVKDGAPAEEQDIAKLYGY